MGDITQFKELLEEYYVVKNKPEPGDKQSDINRIKMDINNDFLNQDFQRDSGVRPIDSKVLKEFFSEVDKFEVEYMKSVGFTQAELSDIRSGLALGCATEFTLKFERYILLDTDFKNILIEYQSSTASSASSKKKKRSKSKKHKFKKTGRNSKGTKRNSKRKTNKSNKRKNNKRKYKRSKYKK